MESNVFVGVKFGSAANAASSELTGHMKGSTKLPNNYDYILMPVTNGRYKDTVRASFQKFKYRQGNGAILMDETILKIPEPELQDLCIPPFTVPENEPPSYIGLLSSWLELESHDNLVREMCYQVLLNECKYARFVGINKLILAPPRELSELQMYSQVIARLLNHELIYSTPPLLLSISLPLYEDSDSLATWDLWHTIRKLCGYHPSLSISLAVPRTKTPSHVLNRWLCEPVSCLLISSSIFATNQYAYPVLHKFNQNLIMKFQKINGNSLPSNNSELCIILHGMEKYSNRIKGGESAYLEYINYLLKKGDNLSVPGDKNSRSSQHDNTLFQQQQQRQHYFDLHSPRLMPPLKPHSESLTNYVYSVFEQDSIKYDMYQDAIQKALHDLIASSRSQSLVVLIAGAGRGPMVERAIRASKYLKVLDKVKIIALEKNKQACLYLQKRNFDSWNNKVQIIKEDMRLWKDESIKVDLCVSELLGSFGCNELSPECLYTVERYHSKTNTIFIPQSYTSYIAPIASYLLHQKVNELNKDNESVWIMHNVPYCILSSKINELWTFEHPISEFELSAAPFIKNVVTEFKVKYRGEIHGLIGFFTAKLYNDIHISTLPDESIVKLLPDSDVQGLKKLNVSSSPDPFMYPSEAGVNVVGGKYKKFSHTPNMHSWSPLVFPLKEPFSVTDDTELSVFISRNYSVQNRSVWYEWSVESFVYLLLSGASTRRATNQKAASQTTTSSHKPGLHRSGHQANPIGLSSEGDGAAFSNTLPENAFLPVHESGWQSVNDIHGLSNGFDREERPLFDLGADDIGKLDEEEEDEDDEDEEDEEDVHVRVKTGASALHNVNGQSFSLQL